MDNPWLRKQWETWVQPVTVEDRISEMKGFNEKKLTAVINYPGTQKTVKKAAEIMIRKLRKKQK